MGCSIGAAYYQSFEMVRLVIWLRGEAVLASVVADLAAGRVSPEASFAAATGLDGSELGKKWEEFVKRD